ncbi:MAG: potassium channel family protein, partial [Candidatus Cloacimonadaceae bacterium]|nr:potassium channel family protein [Candidatus Cloacimonadaceae bacterium]
MKYFSRGRSSKLSRSLANKYFITADNRKLIDRFLIVCLFITILIFLSSYLVWKMEYNGTQENTIRTFWDSIWWAIVTVATVGYGDKVPLTHYGRMVGLVLIVVGFALLSVFTGLIASLFVEDRIKGAKGLKQIRAHHHIVVCGWNKTGEALLRT